MENLDHTWIKQGEVYSSAKLFSQRLEKWLVISIRLYHETSYTHVMDNQSSTYSITNLFTAQDIYIANHAHIK